MPSASNTAPKYRRGDRVTFRYGLRPVLAKVVEDRGNLGVKGRRLYRIRLEQEADEQLAFEVPEDDLSPAVLQKADILRHLKEEGLIEILRSNLGGKDPPRVWLTLDGRGRVIHTFIPDRGMIGGVAAPFWSLHKEKIDWRSKNSVVDFLASFGLSESEAEEVIEAVGISTPDET